MSDLRETTQSCSKCVMLELRRFLVVDAAFDSAAAISVHAAKGSKIRFTRFTAGVFLPAFPGALSVQVIEVVV